MIFVCILYRSSCVSKLTFRVYGLTRNGLTLCSNCHVLFDKHVWFVHPDLLLIVKGPPRDIPAAEVSALSLPSKSVLENVGSVALMTAYPRPLAPIADPSRGLSVPLQLT